MKHYLPIFTIIMSVILISCNANENSSVDTLSDTTSITGLSADSVKLVKTASIIFKVKDVEQSTRDVSAIAKKLGGMIYNQALESVEGRENEFKVSNDSLMVVTTVTPRADITARIPSNNLEEFLYSVTDIGYFTSSSKLNIDDRSLSYLESALEQKNRKEVLSNTAKGTPSSIETIEVKDEVVEQEISNRTIDADVKYSIVNLSLYQNPLIRKEVIANYNTLDYQLPFGKKLSNAISDGYSYFLSFILVIAHLWMFILVTIVIFLSYRHLQQKRKPQSHNV